MLARSRWPSPRSPSWWGCPTHVCQVGKAGGEDADPSAVPTERSTLQVSGPLPGHLAHVGLDGLLKWGPHIHPGVRGGGQSTGSRGEVKGRPQRDRGAVAFPAPLPPPSAVTRVQILHLLGNRYALGVPFKPPRKHNGGGAAVAWATVQRPQAFLEGTGFQGRKSSGHWSL